MGPLTRHQPKGMTELGGGYTILSRQLQLLCQAGVEQAVVTTGPFPQALRSHVEGLGLPLSVSYVHSPQYQTSNYIVSMHLAAPLLAGADVLLLHGDLVLEASVLKDLLRHPENAMAVDATLPLPQKDFKAKLREGRIIAVGVDLFGPDCVACQPAYRWQAEGFACWMDGISQFLERGETQVYAENAFNALGGALPLYPLELAGRLCHEVDTPQDLEAIRPRFFHSLSQQNPEVNL